MRFVRQLIRLLMLVMLGAAATATWRWLRGPDAPIFSADWPADKPWPPISATDE